ncbi:coiled-coil domain-containing protein [Paenibacillus sp. FA6]|uniref:coiled-coil domain-containing protein n=1 Tax=Paenibacillus sp. FA6 TaxID=3413029 RepID=UPI003F65FA5D
MKERKLHFIILGILISLLIYSINYSSGIISAEPLVPLDEETRQLLEKSLSILEIDHEIERINKRQNDMEQEQEQLQLELLQKSSQIQDMQDRAGDIIRSYYMGERDFLYSALLSIHNISEFFMIYNYYDLIINHDKEILSTYKSQYNDLQLTQQRIARNSDELNDIRLKLISQRDRILVFQKSIDGSLETSNNPEAMQQMMDEFNLYWENVGLYEVKRHFKALASAMNDLPEFIQNTKGVISAKGSTYTIDITEDQLNTFLRSKNDLFNVFSFHFGDNSITASGQSGNLSLTIEGKYSIVNEPKNGIIFQVDKLFFNNLQLPDTTCRALEEEFDLGFYPQNLVSFLKATEVTTSQNHLIVTLKLSM